MSREGLGVSSYISAYIAKGDGVGLQHSLSLLMEAIRVSDNRPSVAPDAATDASRPARRLLNRLINAFSRGREYSSPLVYAMLHAKKIVMMR